MPLPIELKTPSNIVLQQEFLERSLSSLFSGSKLLNGSSFRDEQTALQKSLNITRNDEFKTFLQSFCAVMSLIKTLRTDISCEESIYKKAISYFEASMRSIEVDLSVFKSDIKEKILTLQDEEKELQTLISTLSQRINLPTDHEVKTCPTVPVHVGSQISTNSAYDNMHPDIQEFQDFVQKTGGHTGGWASADHLVFCKLLQRKGSENLASAVLELMPDKSEEDVTSHEKWYERYLTLKQAHRQALLEWKKNKDQNSIDEEDKEGRSTSHTNLPYIMCDINRSKAVKARIAEWKRKQDEKRKQEEEKMFLQKKNEDEKWKRKMAYFERQRNLLLQRRKEKTQDMSKQLGEGPLGKQLKEVEHLEKILGSSNLTLKDFRQFDDQFVMRRISRLERHRRRSSIGSDRQRSTSISTIAKRDPTRLLQPTAIWKIRLNRSKSECNVEGQRRTTQFFINNIPHLGVPEWRKGIA